MNSRAEAIVVDGQTIGRRRNGNPTYLFLHGLAGHHGEWSAVIDLLPPDSGTIAVDLRGHGAHPQRWADDQSLIDDAIALVESVGAAIVVGQSMGSIVALRVAAQRPDLVSHLVMIEGGITRGDEAGQAALAEWFDSWPTVFADRAEAAAFFGADRPSTPAWVDGLKHTAKGLVARFDAQELLRGMASIGSADRGEIWKQVTAPTTIIVADAGMIGGADVERMLALRPDADLVRITDAGHDVHLDQPEQVAAVLRGSLHR